MNILSAQQLKQKLEINKDFLLIDIRTPDEWNQWFIHWTDKFLDMSSEQFIVEMEELLKNNNLVIYCNSGSRSMYALYYFLSNWFNNIHHLDWGILSWLSQWYNIVTL